MKTDVIIKGKEAFPSGYVSLQTEQVLREGESHYKNLVEKIPAIIYTFSNLRGGLYYSAGVEAILGYEQHDLLENVWLWHDSIHLDDLVRVDKAVQDSLAGAAFELDIASEISLVLGIGSEIAFSKKLSWKMKFLLMGLPSISHK